MTQRDWQVVVVNYRTPTLALRAARSARRAEPQADILVVDSGSDVPSQDLLEIQTVARYKPLPENRGYAAALNAGAREGDSRYLLLLNADVEVSPESVRVFQRHFEAHSRLGILAPRLVSPDGGVQPSCRRFPTYHSLLVSRGSPVGWLHTAARRSYRIPEPNSFTLTDVVAGACLAVRRDAWEDLGGMDERFFLYAEDTDLCKRAKQAGWLVGYEPLVTARHEWGASTQLARRASHRLHAESLSRYFRKHHPERWCLNTLVSWILWVHARLRF